MNKYSCNIVTNNHSIDIVLKTYSNRDLLIATHLKKFGPLLLITRESSLNNDFNNDNNVFSIRTFFGYANAEICAAARYIAEQINIDKPLLLSLALKDYKIETLKSIVAAVNHLKT